MRAPSPSTYRSTITAAPNLEKIVCQTDQLPLGRYLLQSSQEKLADSPRGLDHAEYWLDDVLARRVESFAGRRTEFVLHLLLDTRFGRGRSRLGRSRCCVVLLSTAGEVWVDTDLLQLADRFFAEVARVGCVRNRRRRAVGRCRPLDPCCLQVVQGRL